MTKTHIHNRLQNTNDRRRIAILSKVQLEEIIPSIVQDMLDTRPSKSLHLFKAGEDLHGLRCVAAAVQGHISGVGGAWGRRGVGAVKRGILTSDD